MGSMAFSLNKISKSAMQSADLLKRVYKIQELLTFDLTIILVQVN